MRRPYNKKCALVVCGGAGYERVTNWNGQHHNHNNFGIYGGWRTEGYKFYKEVNRAAIRLIHTVE